MSEPKGVLRHARTEILRINSSAVSVRVFLKDENNQEWFFTRGFFTSELERSKQPVESPMSSPLSKVIKNRIRRLRAIADGKPETLSNAVNAPLIAGDLIRVTEYQHSGYEYKRLELTQGGQSWLEFYEGLLAQEKSAGG